MATENLKKRGIQGPSHCVFCKEVEETIDHLFLQCKFSTEVWSLAVQELHINLILPTNWNDLFACWKYYYHGSLLQKSDLTRASVALPKYLCWKIWVTRNKELFEGEASNPRKVMIVAKSLWVEVLVMRGVKHTNNDPLNSEERVWALDFLKPVTNRWHTAAKRPNCLNWQLRMSEEYFSNWRVNLGCKSVFFDGDSKGNPGLAGAGGVIFELGGNKQKDYSWG